MTVFEKIAQMSDVLKGQTASVNLDTTLTYREHYAQMINMLSILTEELRNAEYNYVVENLENDTHHTFQELNLSASHLNENIILIQPCPENEMQMQMIDMKSLFDIACKMKKSGIVKEDIIFIPPWVNVLKAKLAGWDPNAPDPETEMSEWEKNFNENVT